MFQRNIGGLPSDFTVLYPRRQYSPQNTFPPNLKIGKNMKPQLINNF
jgi:hypothetical protein